MSVFRNYNPQKAGDVNANAFPNMYPQPWVPIQRNVRGNPNIPAQPQRIQPNERGTFYPTSASNGGTLSPAMSSSGSCGCGGGGGCSGAAVQPPTAAQIATGHAFPGIGGRFGSHSKQMTPRIQSRTTGAIRAMPIRGGVMNSRTGTKLSPGGISNRRSGI